MHAYHDAWERGDQEAGMSFYAEDLVVHMGGAGPLAGTYTSREDFNTNWIGRVADYTDIWDVLGNLNTAGRRGRGWLLPRYASTGRAVSAR